MKRLFIVVFVAILSVFAVSGCGGSGVNSAVDDVFKAMSSRSITDFINCYPPSARAAVKEILDERVKENLDAREPFEEDIFESFSKIKSHKVIKVKENGDDAEVTVEVTSFSGESEEMDMHLRKENGKWYLYERL